MQILKTITSTLRGRLGTCAQNPERSHPCEKGRGINRWVIYKHLCVAKSEFGLNDRCLAVLSSLLSFLPDDEISEKRGIVVFPSNRQLSLRAHGMPESTLRRHLASLIEAGIIARNDSPTRKRYAHKDREGAVALAFGFSFAPLLDRASEITSSADKILADQRTLKLLRDEVSVIRRYIAAAFSENANESASLVEVLKALFVRFRGVVDTIPRRASINELTTIKVNLEAIRQELVIALKNMDIVSEMSGIVAQTERQHNESLPESQFESKNVKVVDLKSPRPETPETVMRARPHSAEVSVSTLPLDMVLRACPNIRDYSSNGIASWRDLIDASRTVSTFLGITQSAYALACQVMGIQSVSAVVASILQRIGEINSAGGYLRSLTQKAKAGEFSVAQMLMVGLKANAASAV